MSSLQTDPPGRAGYVFAIVSSVAAGTATVVGKWNLREISALVMACCMFSVATGALSVTWLPYGGLKRVFGHSRRGWLWIALFTATSLAAVWSFWAGVRQMDPTLAAFLNRFEVPVAILMGVIFLGERFTRIETVGVVLSLAGIAIMRATLRVEYSTGFWLVLLGALFFGTTEFVSKIAVRHVEPIALAYLRNMFMAAAYWIVVTSSGRDLSGLERVWPGVLAVGLLGPILSRMMYLKALKRMDLSKVAVISQSQPVFVVLIALTFLGQVPTFREVIGGICLISGCLLMIVAHQRRQPQDAARLQTGG